MSQTPSQVTTDLAISSALASASAPAIVTAPATLSSSVSVSAPAPTAPSISAATSAAKSAGPANPKKESEQTQNATPAKDANLAALQKKIDETAQGEDKDKENFEKLKDLLRKYTREKTASILNDYFPDGTTIMHRAAKSSSNNAGSIYQLAHRWGGDLEKPMKRDDFIGPFQTPHQTPLFFLKQNKSKYKAYLAYDELFKKCQQALPNKQNADAIKSFKKANPDTASLAKKTKDESELKAKNEADLKAPSLANLQVPSAKETADLKTKKAKDEADFQVKKEKDEADLKAKKASDQAAQAAQIRKNLRIKIVKATLGTDLNLVINLIAEYNKIARFNINERGHGTGKDTTIMHYATHQKYANLGNVDIIVYLELIEGADMELSSEGEALKTPLNYLKAQPEKYKAYLAKKEVELKRIRAENEDKTEYRAIGRKAFDELCKATQKLNLEEFKALFAKFEKKFGCIDINTFEVGKNGIGLLHAATFPMTLGSPLNFDIILFLELDKKGNMEAQSEIGTPKENLKEGGFFEAYEKRKNEILNQGKKEILFSNANGNSNANCKGSLDERYQALLQIKEVKEFKKALEAFITDFEDELSGQEYVTFMSALVKNAHDNDNADILKYLYNRSQEEEASFQASMASLQKP